MADFDRDAMLDTFIFELGQLIEQLEQYIIQGESGYSMNQINEIFRIMHTIKGSAAMMMFDNISATAHSIEDLFYYLREESPQNVDYPRLTDLVLEGMDFIKNELTKIENRQTADGDGSGIIATIKEFLSEIKGSPTVGAPTAGAPTVSVPTVGVPTVSAPTAGVHTVGAFHRYKALIIFKEDSGMENIRAYTLLHNLSGAIQDVATEPSDVNDEDMAEVIRKNGFLLTFSTDKDYDEMYQMLSETIYLKDLQLEEISAAELKQFTVSVMFSDESEMENVRAFALVHKLQEVMENVTHEPEDLLTDTALLAVRKDGVKLFVSTAKNKSNLQALLDSTAYVKSFHIDEAAAPPAQAPAEQAPPAQAPAEQAPPAPIAKEPGAPAPSPAKPDEGAQSKKSQPQQMISVNVSKLDHLLNLMGELVISEAMVTQNPELDNLNLESFHKEARQLRKIIKDLQETVMSMRMVPLSTTFFKMNRIVRDMCRQLGKDVQLVVEGEETEVDKNIIEHISDPLMHIIRNSVDHGIEMPEVRRKVGKNEKGTVILDAKNAGGDVLIIVRDDGAGLDRERILNKARANGLLKKAENEYSDREIHQFIFLPGFSTNEKVTSFSGRGVGMDVVTTNLEMVGGSVLVESTPGLGSVFTLKIPLTLAIIEGMTVKMGGAKYTIPIVSIKQSFKASQKEIFIDPNGNEMISTRGEIFNVVRLYEFFDADSAVKNIEDGILIMLENGAQTVCVLVDELLGEQQVVVKSIPKFFRKIRGISGCTLLGNGEISLIIDVTGFFDK